MSDSNPMSLSCIRLGFAMHIMRMGVATDTDPHALSDELGEVKCAVSEKSFKRTDELTLLKKGEEYRLVLKGQEAAEWSIVEIGHESSFASEGDELLDFFRRVLTDPTVNAKITD